VFLGLAGLFWSGSKSGWLIALAIGAFWLLRLNWSRQLKWLVVIILLVGGLTVFGVRFQKYFAKGATSVSARFDYWHAAARTALDHPALGSGPGTFQRPYARLKRPESEMARLVHNDYLEQFSDSGFIGGLTYLTWLGLLLWTLGRVTWKTTDWLGFAIFAGLLGWFLQGFIEFGLFIPALAWTAFTLAGCLLAQSRNQFDKPTHPV
jgi:O-antigen ligase